MNYTMIDELRRRKPLVHHITNYVTVSECANITLNMGALPVMACAPEEVEQMVSAAGALVLNIGTLSAEQVRTMILAGQKAASLGIPVILDPVGAGATDMRTEAARRIINKVPLAAIKGNAAEISILAGYHARISGVEALEVAHDMTEVARRFAGETESIVIVTAREDIVTDGNRVCLVENGHSLMGELVGTGCMAASVLGSFMALGHNHLESAAVALASFEIAAEMAAERKDVSGPGTFRAALMDEARRLTGATVAARGRIRYLQPDPLR